MIKNLNDSGFNIRLDELIKYLGITKTKFAEQIGLSQSYVSRMVAGDSMPSERTINDICSYYCINRDWLMYGNGEMRRQLPANEELAEEISKIIDGGDDFIINLFLALAKLQPAQWDAVKTFIATIKAK